MTATIVKPAMPLAAACLLATLLPLSGCKQRPTITFLEVPRSSLGGSGVTGTIRGKVNRDKHDRHIFLYALADGNWWIQPLASTPSTEIADDGTWKANIHLGTEYAALLSKGDTLPPQLLNSLPPVGGPIEAVARVKGQRDEAQLREPINSPRVRFGGIDWQPRTIPGDYGAKTNDYSADNVSVDASGALHMRLTSKAGGGWVCSEVHTVRSLGYGRYTLEVQDAGHLEPAVMFSAFTFFRDPKATEHRGIDIHVTRRGIASNTNAEFVVEPSFVPTNFYHFEVPSGPLQLGLNWQPDAVEFSASAKHLSAGQRDTSWIFRTGVPKANDTNFYINLCNYGYAPTGPTHDAEVVVKAFEFYP